MSQLHTRDYERMLDLLVAVLENDDPASSGQLIAGQLHAAFDCNTVIFAELRPVQRTGRAEGWAPESIGESAGEVIRRRVLQKHPLISYMATDLRGPVIVSDICERWRHSQIYSEARRDYGTTQQLGVPLPPVEPGVLRAVSLGRLGDFSAHELAFAERIQPLLIGADRHIREQTRLREALAAAGGAARPVEDHGLTPRELTVLGLLAEGLTADGIGRRLTISPHTVNRHLEKVYRKLGTNNRVSTVSLARRFGLVV
ncbi:helix-turn-helix transcriptional regulator [Streptomyces olivoreticuli]|uniref:helix-turn-helix transcriptional regulator n=1 Tax=Streptomyces olivoreticuli TaxID=68246 RepID=UPI000E21C334|nr:LuxR C-terminal-related transcriptional regulator [Streptomyces olivoreticuli]